MAKFIETLKDLGEKLTGKRPEGREINDVLGDIVNNYKGVVEVDNIEELSSDVCEALVVGQSVIKNDNGNKHAYVVSYKEDGVGMCLTYADCENVETISYDCVEGVWTFNSKDVTHIATE